jgi:hypothetical protein
MHNAGAFSWAEMRETGERLAVMVMGDLNDEVEAATTQIINGGPGSGDRHSGLRPPRYRR